MAAGRCAGHCRVPLLLTPAVGSSLDGNGLRRPWVAVTMLLDTALGEGFYGFPSQGLVEDEQLTSPTAERRAGGLRRCRHK